jgi:hypothetical protein
MIGMAVKVKKQPKISTLKKKVWKAFSEYIRLRDCLATTGLPDYGECITCSKVIPRTLLQAGHFIPGRHNANLFSEKGTHAQCYNCNINLRGNTLEYRRKIIEKYGEGYDEILEEESHQIRKFTSSELEELLAYYREKNRELLHGIKEAQ